MPPHHLSGFVNVRIRCYRYQRGAHHRSRSCPCRGEGPSHNADDDVPFSYYAYGFPVLIDDDEIFEDPSFLAKALEFIGRDIEGNTVRGVAGFYVNPDDDCAACHSVFRQEPCA